MTPKQMLKKPVEKRRGAVTQETGSWAYLLIGEEPDKVLDGLLAAKAIGAARRDCLKEVRKGSVPRPVGPWGILVRLKGQPWTYLVGDGMRFEMAREWAERHGWRVALFTLDGMINTKVARMYEGTREIFNFTCGLIKEPEEGFAFHELEDDAAMIRGEAKQCSKEWLEKLKSGGEAMDLLAQAADAYLPVALFKKDEEGKAGVGGWDGDPYPDDEDEAQDIPESAFERVDVFTFGGPETLEPTAAAVALGKAVRAGDAEGARRAIEQGADPNVMCDDDQPPLEVSLGLGSKFLQGGRFAKVSLDRQLKLMEALLSAGAKADAPGREPSIHTAIHWAEGGNEKDIVAQLRVLLKHKADANATGGFLRSVGQRPLHVVARFNHWPAVTKLLVQNGSDVKLTNANGQTPREVAEKVVADLRKSLPKEPAPGGEKAGDLLSGVSLFTKGLMSEDSGEKKSILQMMGANLERVAAEENRKKLVGAEKVLAILTDAENGRVDFSDIDALCEASSAKYAEEKRKEEEQRNAAVSHLEGAMGQLIGQFKKLSEGEGKE